MLALAAAVLIAAGAGWYFVYGPGKPPPPPPPVVEAEPEPVVEEEPEPELPALDASDPFLRSLFAAITANPDALAWLLGDDLARRIAVGHGQRRRRDVSAPGARPAVTGGRVPRRR